MRARKEGIKAKYPVIMIPGVISTGLESWGTEEQSRQYFRKRLWGSWSMMRALVMDKASWKRHGTFLLDRILRILRLPQQELLHLRVKIHRVASDSQILGHGGSPVVNRRSSPASEFACAAPRRVSRWQNASAFVSKWQRRCQVADSSPLTQGFVLSC